MRRGPTHYQPPNPVSAPGGSGCGLKPTSDAGSAKPGMGGSGCGLKARFDQEPPSRELMMGGSGCGLNPFMDKELVNNAPGCGGSG